MNNLALSTRNFSESIRYINNVLPTQNRPPHTENESDQVLKTLYGKSQQIKRKCTLNYKFKVKSRNARKTFYLSEI